MPVFIHAADDQVGMPRNFLPSEAQKRCTNDRIETVTRTMRDERQPALRTLRERKVPLDARREQLQHHRDQSRQTHEALTDAEPEALRERHADRGQALELRGTELVRDERELRTLTGRIDAQLGEGTAGAIDAAEQKPLHAQERERGLRRRAAAVGLLTKVLNGTIVLTSQERSEPLRQQLLRYGKEPSGNELDIRLGTSLHITERRRLVTRGRLPYGALSVGAKTQFVTSSRCPEASDANVETDPRTLRPCC